MKTIYLNGNKFNYNSMEELREECKKYNISIGYGVKLGKWVELGEHVKIGIDVELGDRVKIGNYVELGEYVKIGNYVELGEHVKIGNYVELREGVELGDNVKLGNETKILRNTESRNQIVLYNHYRYTASGYIDKRTNKPVIQLGCLVKFAEDYKFGTDEFYTNEFQKGTEETKKREETFLLLKKILENKLGEKEEE